jgi:hypothetical protein
VQDVSYELIDEELIEMEPTEPHIFPEIKLTANQIFAAAK